MIKEVHKPYTLNEALDLLENNKAKILAGGTDLILEAKNDRFDKEILVDISDIEELKYVEARDNKVRIGACTTCSELIKYEFMDRNLSGLKKACKLLGSPQIRNKATIGGNICNASPSADIIPPLIALDSSVYIKSKYVERKIKLIDLVSNRDLAIKDNEILTYIEFEKLNKNQYLSFYKLGLRKSLAISRISASVCVDIEEGKFSNIKVSLGSISNMAIRAYEVEEHLKGKFIEKNIINEALDILEKNVEKSLKNRSTMEFKSYAVKGVLKEAIDEAINSYNAI